LLFLGEPCQLFERILDNDLEQNISIAKMNEAEPEHGLTLNESASIDLYIMEWNVPENSLYVILNCTLRPADR
jgi:hypothetical protein